MGLRLFLAITAKDASVLPPPYRGSQCRSNGFPRRSYIICVHECEINLLLRFCTLSHNFRGVELEKCALLPVELPIAIDNGTDLGYNIIMEEQDLLAVTIGRNIMRLRRMANMTQLELAEKINYSDKSVSKWEQGNGIPDVRILVQLADLFNVSVDDLVREHADAPVMPKRTRLMRRIITMLLSVGLCWLVAVVVFVFCGIGLGHFNGVWLAFLYAVPASAIVVLVFSCVWRYPWVRIASVTVLIWTVLACIHLTALVCGLDFDAVPMDYIYLIGVPLQILSLIFYFPWKRIRNPFYKDKG